MFAFYDFETTGTDPAFDQPLQFAAILTDDEFNEVERVNLRCRLSRLVLPSPMALAITGVMPDVLTDDQLPSLFEFTQQLSDLIDRWGPATWIGYNTIKFDEEVLRQAFYQNLHPSIYRTQLDGNDRMDLMKLIYAVRVLQPDLLEWPMNAKGQISYKLDQLAPANGFANHDAHDALGDVEATIHIADLIRKGAPDVWSEALRNRSKQQNNELLETGQPLRLVERFGGGEPASYIGAFAGRNPQNPNQVGFLDLEAVDPRDLVNANDAVIFGAVDATPKLIRTVTVNKYPSLFANPTVTEDIADRATALADMSELHDRVGAALAGRFADREQPEHVEKLIYAGFPSTADTNLLREFQSADWGRRHELLSSFEDARFQQLGRRIVFANQPDQLSEQERNNMRLAVLERWNAEDAPWTTFSKVDEGMAQVRQKGLLEEGSIAALVAFYNRLRG